jgi:TrmH family RNA methyltransferase
MPASPKPSRAPRHATSPGIGRTETISSSENQWIRRFRATLRGSGPSEDGWIGVEGPHLVEEALSSGLGLGALLVSDSGAHHLDRLATELSRDSRGSALRNLRVFRTPDRLFAGVAGTETPQGIAALVSAPERTFDDLLRGEVPLVVILVGVQDPGNVGTVVRSAEAFGATGVLATRGTAHPLSPKALRASAGSALRLPVISGTAAPVALAQLKVAGLRVFATCVESSQSSSRAPATADLRGPIAILIGNEGAGLPAEVERSADARLQIPIAAAVESLNAAVAASVLLYEAARQRGRHE